MQLPKLTLNSAKGRIGGNKHYQDDEIPNNTAVSRNVHLVQRPSSVTPSTEQPVYTAMAVQLLWFSITADVSYCSTVLRQTTVHSDQSTVVVSKYDTNGKDVLSW